MWPHRVPPMVRANCCAVVRRLPFSATKATLAITGGRYDDSGTVEFRPSMYTCSAKIKGHVT